MLLVLLIIRSIVRAKAKIPTYFLTAKLLFRKTFTTEAVYRLSEADAATGGKHEGVIMALVPK